MTLVEAVVHDTGEVVGIGPNGLDIPGRASVVGLELPDGLTIDQWLSIGESLKGVERSMMWWIGDWLRYGEQRYGQMYTQALDQTEYSYQTCRDAKWVADKIELSGRHDNLSWSHHREVAGLSPETRNELLHEAEKEGWSQKELRGQIKGSKRKKKELALADATANASEIIGHKLYNVIYADPEWRFEPYSRQTGMDRAADNHYPTSELDKIKTRYVPAADDCALFLWATVPMLPHALEVMSAWGFEYKSNFVWGKDRIGTGYWNRNKHELLLIGTKGNIPAPAAGTQYESLIIEPVGDHSRKPEKFYEIIEHYYPNVPKLEMNARNERTGWDSWGNETDKYGEKAA